MGTKPNKMKQLSIKWQVSLAFTAMCLLLVTLVSTLQVRAIRADFSRVLSAQQYSLVLRVAEDLDDKLGNCRVFLAGNAKYFPLELLKSPAKIRDYFQTRRGLVTTFDDILIFAPNGDLIADFPELPSRRGLNTADRDFFKEVLATRKLVLSEPVLSKTRKEPIVQMGAPLLDARGNLVGVIVGVIRLYKPNFVGSLSDQRIGKSGYFALITKGQNPVYIIHADKSRILQPQRKGGASRALEGLEGSVESVSSTGVKGLYSGTSLKNAPWALFAVEPIDEAFFPIAAAESRLLNINIAVFLIAIPLIWVLSWRALNPLSRLQRAIAQFKIGGQSFVPVQIERQDEIGELTEAFNLLMVRQQAAEANLRAGEARYRTVISSLAEGVVLTDVEGKITGANASAERILGQSLDEMLGRKLPELKWWPLDSKGLPVARDDLHELPKRPEDRSVADRLLGIQLPEKQMAWYALRVQPVRDDSGADTGGRVTTFSDITELRQAEELRTAKEAAELASRSKSAFLARMSHELRTPLNAVLGFAQLLEFEPTVKQSPGVLKKVETIRSSGRHLLALVDEVLDLSQIESGSAPMKIESLDIAETMDECLRMVSPQAEQARIRIDFLRPDTAQYVRADRTRLTQIVINLLDNAIKYNRADGRIDIAVGGDSTGVRLNIRDSGIGMSKKQLEDLFQPFNRLGRENIAGGAGGAGLGLVISKQLAETMGGQLLVESETDAGTTFALVLPRAAE